MDRDRVSAITHGDRAFHNPLDPARVIEALTTLGLTAGDRCARAHASDRLAADVRAWIDAARARLLAPGGTATIGFALVVLRTAPATS